MSEKVYTVMLVLKSGGDFSFADVDLLAFHLRRHWAGKGKLRLICLGDLISQPYVLHNCELIPLPYKGWKGWWSKMNLFSPELDQYRPFLYMDLDTAVVGDVSVFFPEDENEFIVLENFYRKKRTGSGFMWVPNNEVTKKIWENWIKAPYQHMRMFQGDQDFIEEVKPNKYWQDVNNFLYTFKPRASKRLIELPDNARVICFHGKPRIWEAAKTVDWVGKYIRKQRRNSPLVSVVIPYKDDRGWLQAAIDSVKGDNVQLIVSQGEGNWANNFNNALPKVRGEYVRFLHEDDMLTEGSIDYAVQTFEERDVDFIHSPALISEMGSEMGREFVWTPEKTEISFEDLMEKNYIHGVTTMYKTKIFEEIGGFDETLPDSEEYEFHLRCLKAGYKLGYCKKPLGIYRRHRKQASRLIPKGQMHETSRNIKKSFYE